jgi:hypothetical protein
VVTTILEEHITSIFKVEVSQNGDGMGTANEKGDKWKKGDGKGKMTERQ